MRAADIVVDIGPGAGSEGGRILCQGTPAEAAAHPASVTGQFLAGIQQITRRDVRRRTAKSRSICLEGARHHNLKNIDVVIPLNAFVCVTGVSGSGKSSLISETLAPAILQQLAKADSRGRARRISNGLAQNAIKPGRHSGLRGIGQIDKFVPIDQTPLGRTPRSNAATFTRAFDEIRKVFAATRLAKQYGFSASRFSFNAKEGRCEACEGQGVQKLEMNFLPDLFVTCEECRGTRFNQQTLRVKYRGRSIADILDMSVDEAVSFWQNFAQIHRILVTLQEVGLGYLPLGQPSTTLSGGEAQRVKLANELSRVDTGKTLYLLDEPTSGLHFIDIQRLLNVLHRLVDRGNSVIVIEHHLDVIKSADWIIDLGPEGGAAGGYLVAEGTPEAVAQCEASHTGRAIRESMAIRYPDPPTL
jgi:excinuclease ABC subunit A